MTITNNPPQIVPTFSWQEIDTILLDMDGTLLDKYFDDHFWEEYVPQVFANKYNCTPSDARETLLAKYRSVENTLQWTDLDYWSEQLNLDIPKLKGDVDHLIQIHPHVVDFLTFLSTLNKNIYLVTNAHSKTLKIKMNKVNLEHHFDRLICSDEVGEAKEQPIFWEKLQQIVQFNPKTTLFVDDTAKVLDSAHTYGLNHLLFIAKPSSKLPVRYSDKYPAVAFFDELLPKN